MHRVGLVLAGGGGKGAYQIGAWRALREHGLNFSHVSGTSVGALNAALVCADDLARAQQLWSDISPDQVFTIRTKNVVALLLRMAAFLGFDYFRKATPASYETFVKATWALGLAAATVCMIFYGEINERLPAFLQYRAWYSYPLLFVAIVTAQVLLSLLLTVPISLWEWLDRRQLFAMDNTPLRRLIERHVDTNAIRASHRRLVVCAARRAVTFDTERPTYFEVPGSDGNMHEVGLHRDYLPVYSDLNDLPVSQIVDRLVETTCLPFGLFKNWASDRDLLDGGVADNTPLLPLITRGCDVVVIVHLDRRAKDGPFDLSTDLGNAQKMARMRRLLEVESTSEQALAAFIAKHGRTFSHDTPGGSGASEKRYAAEPLPKLVHVIPSKSLGGLFRGTLRFSARRSRYLMELGYADARRVLAKTPELVGTA